MSAKIKNIKAYEVLSSGGKPTVEASVELENGVMEHASVPFGASAGVHEAHIMFDNDPKRYGGQGMLKACHTVEQVIAKKLKGKVATNQKKIDELMVKLDGTPNKKRLGGNAILAVSLAVARAASASAKKPLYKYIRSAYKLPYKDWRLPKPMMVVIEGGEHADNSTDFQEYLMSVNGARTVREAVRWGEETYQALKGVLKKKNLNTNVGNEGAFAPAGISSNQEPLELIMDAIQKAGYKPGRDISISLDPAASEFYDAQTKQYVLQCEHAGLSSDQMIGLYNEWLQKYPILSLEDGLAEDDWSGWPKLFSKLSAHTRIIGDDLTVTNKERLKKAIEQKAINGVLIKLNQIGTLTETIETIQLGRKKKYWQVISHRGGGETNDTFMIDLAVAVNAEYVKVGPTRGERTGKYNRLLRIEQEVK